MVLFLMKIRENVLVRWLLMPFVLLKRKLEIKKFENSKDAIYIRTLKNRYAGKRCFIIGNGPSLQAADLDRLEKEFTFACNRIYDIYEKTKWKPSIYMCLDTNIINDMQIKNQDLEILSDSIIFFRSKAIVKKYNNLIDIHFFTMNGKYYVKREQLAITKISEDVSKYFSLTQSVSCSMLELAIYMGFKEIYLLGMDHNFGIEVDMRGNKIINNDVVPHFKEQQDRAVYPSNKEALTKSYETFKKYGELHGIKIMNATRGGKLEVFERIDLEKLLEN